MGPRYLLIGLIALALVVLGAAAAWWFLPERAEGVVVWSLALREYHDPLPNTPFAVQDRDASRSSQRPSIRISKRISNHS